MAAKKPASLVMFSSLPLVGGHTIITLKLCEILRDRFSQICVITKEMPGHGHSLLAVKQLEAMGVKVTTLHGSKLNSLSSLTRIFIHERQPDVFLSIGMRHLSPALVLALRPKQSVHYHITHELSPKILRQLTLYQRVFTKLVFISPATWLDYRKKSETGQTYWAVQATECPVPPPLKVLRESGPIRFGLLGRLNEAKGSKTLLDFMNKTPVACELHVAGRGEYEKEFTAFASKNNPLRTVTYHGSYDADQRTEFLKSFFNKIDYLCVPSLDDREGVPTVILEALQHGVPTLATHTGGTRSFSMKQFGPATPDVVQLFSPTEIQSVLQNAAASPAPKASAQCRDYYRKYFSDAVLSAHWYAILAENR